MKLATRAALATATVLSIAATPAAASAQNVIPGDLNPGNVVITWLPGVTVDVTQSPSSLDTVTVTVTNNSGIELWCNGPDQNSGIGATVTTGPVAQAAMQYYANFEYKPDPKDNLGSGDYGAIIEWNAILAFLPTGSASPIFGPSYAALDWIARQHTAATLKGHTGTSDRFTVRNGQIFPTTITLSPPSNGPRTDFDAAAYLVCTGGGKTYAFAGYENGPPSPTNDGTLPIGSIGRR